jgi:hypothetical protein
MRAIVCVLAMLLVGGLGSTAADAARRGGDPSSGGEWWSASLQNGGGEKSRAQSDGGRERASRSNGRSERSTRGRSERSSERSEGSSSGVGPRPGAWCGWYMRTRHGGGPEYNLAWTWSRYGSAGSPQVGAIVVWSHHVGEITGRAANGQWIVLSGNDGGQVRERARSISGAVVRV